MAKKIFIKKMKKIPLEEFLIYLILESYVSVLTHQELIDKWNNPKDLVQRSAVMLRDVHKIYGKFASMIYRDLVKK